MADMIKGQVRAEAAGRRREGNSRGGKNNAEKQVGVSRDTDLSSKPDKTKSRIPIAVAVGIGHATLAKAANVVKNDTPELIKAMDAKRAGTPTHLPRPPRSSTHS